MISMRGSDGRRFRRSSCCGRSCCKRSIQSARSGSSWSGWTSTCCSGGSSGLVSTPRSGTTRLSRRTGIACSRATSPPSSWPRCWISPGSAACCRASTSASMAAWSKPGASMKSFRPKDEPDEPPTGGRNDSRDFHGERRANDSHASTTDPDARLYRKGPGQEAKLCFVGHVLMENRHGLVVDAELTRVSGHAERLAALAMLDRLPTVGPMTLAADRGFDARDFVMELRERRVTPHIAQNTSGRRSAIDRRTTRHPGYGASQRIRKRIEEAFGWIKTIAGQARTKLRGLARVRWSFTLAAAAYNLVRLPRLLAGSAG